MLLRVKIRLPIHAATAVLVGSVSSNWTGRCVFHCKTIARASTWLPWLIADTQIDEIESGMHTVGYKLSVAVTFHLNAVGDQLR